VATDDEDRDDREGDFAVVVFREEETWAAAALPSSSVADLETLLRALRRQPTEGVRLGLVCVDDDFFVAVRLDSSEPRLLLSDVTAATEWPLARQLVETLGLPVPDDDEDVEQAQPAGDMTIFADLGMDGRELGALCDDLELYPDEMLASVASRLGFAEVYDGAVETALR
jgi:putative tRNA adenosine deaminase-associated protein